MPVEYSTFTDPLHLESADKETTFNIIAPLKKLFTRHGDILKYSLTFCLKSLAWQDKMLLEN